MPYRHEPSRVPVDHPRSLLGWVLIAALVWVIVIAAAVAVSRSEPPSSHQDATRTGTPLPGARSLAPEVRESAVTSGLYPDPAASGVPLPPAPTSGVGSEGVSAPTTPMPASSTRVGFATWYDDGPGFYGAVHSWRFGHDRYAVQVCLAAHPGTCTHVVVRDFCACGSRNGTPTLIDLSPSAFRELAPLSRGVVRVIVSGRIDIPLPPTDEVTP